MTGLVQHVVDAVSQGSLFALFALGVAFIFGVARVVNFAHGEFIMIGGYIVVLCASLAWPVVLLIVVLAVVAIAILAERVVFRPARRTEPTTVLVIAFSLSVFLQNAVLALAGPRARSVNLGAWLVQPVRIGEVRVPRIDLVTVGVTVVLLVALAFVLHRTSVGRQLRASAEDFSMARLVGVRANVVIAIAFAVSGLLAAVAGLLLTVQTGTLTTDAGLQPVLTAFVATVIGGLGSLTGAIAGGYLLGALTVLLQVALPTSLSPYHEAFVLALVIAILLFRPQGLLPAAAQRERI